MPKCSNDEKSILGFGSPLTLFRALSFEVVQLQEFGVHLIKLPSYVNYFSFGETTPIILGVDLLL